MESSMRVGPVLLEALGIDTSNVIEATIELKTDQPVYVTLRQFVKAPNLATGIDKLKTEMKRFSLVEIGGPDYFEAWSIGHKEPTKVLKNPVKNFKHPINPQLAYN